MFYFARCTNIIFNSLLAQLVKYDVHTTRKIKYTHSIFSERELMFMFAICRRPSVCRLSSVCLSPVCNVRAPYSAD